MHVPCLNKNARLVIPLFWSRYKTGKDLAKRGAPTAPPLRAFMLGYNAVAALFSMYCFWQSVDVMMRLPIKSGDCELFARDPTFRHVITLFYLSKYPEFFDTIFLIVRAKRVSWLHYIH